MIIVSGHLRVRPGTRDHYLETCRDVVRLARTHRRCVDFALSPDLVEEDRADVLEVWTGAEALAAFRGGRHR